MILVDVNVLVYAHREDATDHERHKAWLIAALASDEPVGVADVVLNGFLHVVTHPKVFTPPTPIATAIAFADAVRNQPNAVRVAPGERHWDVFTRMCREANVKGNLVPDAYLAAIAVENGCELITTDRDFSRFAGLRWRHPLTT